MLHVKSLLGLSQLLHPRNNLGELGIEDSPKQVLVRDLLVPEEPLREQIESEQALVNLC